MQFGFVGARMGYEHRFSVICFVEYAENVLLSRFCDCNVWGVVDCARDGINNSTRCR